MTIRGIQSARRLKQTLDRQRRQMEATEEYQEYVIQIERRAAELFEQHFSVKRDFSDEQVNWGRDGF